MKLDLEVDQSFFVNLRNKSYLISATGIGHPCLAIGMGALVQRTLSQNFKKSFKVYSSDLYWTKDQKLDDPSSLTMQQIVDDIEDLRRKLGLSSYILIGHSAYGIVALEYAKIHSPALKGIVMIGTPFNSNAEVAERNNEYFESYADPLRKRIDLERREKFADEDQSNLDPEAQFLRKYIWRDAPRYWHDPTFDCTPLWNGINFDRNILDHFFNIILTKIDVEKGLNKIKCPIFLAAGMSDYDCCPWTWSQIKNFPKLTVSAFNKSGHYPHYEETDLFDERVKSWANSL